MRILDKAETRSQGRHWGDHVETNRYVEMSKVLGLTDGNHRFIVSRSIGRQLHGVQEPL